MFDYVVNVWFRFAVTINDAASVAAQSLLGLQDISGISLSAVVEVVNMPNGEYQLHVFTQMNFDVHFLGKSILHCCKGTTSLWRSSISGTVTTLAANSAFCVALTEQGDMLWLSNHGMRLHPPVVIGSTRSWN